MEDLKPVDDKTPRAGKRLHEVNQVPHSMRQEAQARWGVNVEFNVARENGRYAGPVFTGEEYLAQRVGDKSVVFHRKDHIDFSTGENLQKRHDTNRLNDTNLSIRYEANQGKAFFHDPQRAAIEEMFSRIKKTGEETITKPKDFETFSKQLEQIKNVMVEKHREARNRQFEQRNSPTQRSIEPIEHQAATLER